MVAVRVMATWTTLYAMTWVLLFELLLALAPGGPVAGMIHLALGIAIVALAFGNHRGVRASAAPGRVKRTVQSTMQLSVVVAVIGALLAFDVGAGWTLGLGITMRGILLFAHAFVALAMFAQAAAAGIAFDMWEEKEFSQETVPGEIPPPAA